MTSTQLKQQIDSQITNAVLPNSVTQIIEGNNMKNIVDHIDQQSLSVQNTANQYTDQEILSIATINIPDATDVLKGKVSLAINTNYPQTTNNIDAATPAYVEAAIQQNILNTQGFRELSGRITQQGINPPVLEIFKNDFLTLPVITRFSIGNYGIDLPNVTNIQYNRGIFFIGNSNTPNDINRIWVNRGSTGIDTFVAIRCFLDHTSSLQTQDNVLEVNPFFFRIYN